MGDRPDDRLDRILSDWLRGRKRGAERAPEEVIREHPELADGLRTRFEALRVFEHEGADAPVPESIGNYRILRELGRGAMGIVYEAEQIDLGRRVALKVLAPIVATDPAAIARFSREAQAAARLEHKNLAAVHEFGRDRGFTFYTMELIEGSSLHEWILDRGSGKTRGPDTFRWLAQVFADVANGLQVAHDLEVIHRDIKPSNILLAPDDTPKVVDFGLARIGGGAQTLTSPGEVLGTLHYMSPEQAMAMREEIDARTDVYSLGATLYEALTLQPPFEGEDPVQLISSIVTDEPPQPRRVKPDIPRDLETITLRAMAKERGLRYDSARELAEDLERFLRNESIEARRPGPLSRARWWTKRHPSRTAAGIAGAAAVVLAALLVFVVLAPADLPTIVEGMTLRTYSPSAATGLEAAGISPDATVDDWTRFLLPDRGMGTVAIASTSSPRGYVVDLAAFGAERELLWTAREAWPEYATELGWAGTKSSDLRCVVTRGAGPSGYEESLLVSGFHHGAEFLYVVDPRTGGLRGTWQNPEGILTRLRPPALIGVLPDWSEEPRRLLVAGSLKRKDGSRCPCLMVVESSGETVCRYEFPVLGAVDDEDAMFEDLKIDWSPDHPEVSAWSFDGLYFSILVKDRLLDLSSVRLSIIDGTDRKYDDRHGEGALEKRIEEGGGYQEMLRELAGRVRMEKGS